jgi:ubiquinol-cytochrome c reductase cytochrome b subunit
MTWILRIALIAAPLLAFALTKRLCLALQMRDRRRLTEGEETGQVTQSMNGDLSESHRGLSPTARYRILMRDVPTPLELPAEGPISRRRRLRTVLSGWYYRDLVEMPATDEQRSRIAARTASPEPVREPED